MFKRESTRAVYVKGVQIGAQSKVVIQSMTNTPTHALEATITQIEALAIAGAEIVRLAVPDKRALMVLPEIIQRSTLPLIADIHFDYKLAIGAIEAGIAKIRINPGNVQGEDKLKEIINKAKQYNVPIRIGINGGSIGKSNNKIEYSLKILGEYIQFFEKQKFYDLVISLKTSSVIETIELNKLFTKNYSYPLHLGLTEAGLGEFALIKSAVGIGSLLAEGFGDTIRVSLTGDPLKEIGAAKNILRSLGLLEQGVEIISCPTCGRTEINLEALVKEVEAKTVHLKQSLKIAVMGCVVNGPGEASEADYGICGGKGVGYIFAKGQHIKKVAEEDLVAELIGVIEKDLLG